MNVVVCIKQVPAKSVPLAASGALDRSAAGGRLNPRDLFALEAGLRIAEETGGRVTALTMGPKSAEDCLKTALSMGAEEAVLLCDRAFAGADVYATAHTLSRGIQLLEAADLVVCGQQTTDGDTAQLPFALGARLGIPAVGWVKKLEKIERGQLVVTQELSLGTQRSRLCCPCVLAVGEEIGAVRIPTLRDQLKARKKTVRVLTLEDLGGSAEDYGQSASPTRVCSTHEVRQEQKAEPRALPADEAAALLLNACRKGEQR